MKYLKFLLLALALLLPGCRDHQERLPDEVAEILGLEIDRPLEIVFASPRGETAGPEDYQAVTVVFNQPMKALSAEAAAIAEPFQIDPEVSGRFRWKGAATVSFEPEQPLPHGSSFKVTVPPGLASPSGNELKEPYSFSFETPGPKVVHTYPAGGSDSHRVGKPLFIEFDQPVDPARVNSVLSYSSPQKAPQPKARAVKEEELKSLNEGRDEESRLRADRLVAVDSHELKHGTRYTLKIDKGLAGEGGPIASKEVHLFTFTTLGPLQWKGSPQKAPHAPEHSVPFAFNNMVNSAVLKKHITVTPKVEIEISSYDESDDWNLQSYYLPLEPNTTYTFTVSGEMTDKYGQKLGEDVSFQWRTADRRPLVHVPDGIAVLEASDTLTIPLGLRNVDELTYRMVRLDRRQFLDLLTSNEQGWLWGKNSDWTGPPFEVVKTVKPEGPRNELYTFNLDVKEGLKGRKFGFVYYQVELKAGEERYQRRGLAQVTNLGVTGKFSPENSLFMATSLDRAKPLGGVEATVLDEKGRPLWRGTSSKEGLVRAPGWSTLLGEIPEGTYSPRLYLFLRSGEDEAYVENGGFGQVSNWLFDVPFRWNASRHYLTSEVYSERGLYLPGDEVHLKGSLRDRESGDWTIPEASELAFEVRNSRDEEIDRGEVRINDFGTFHHTLKLPTGGPTGYYRVDYSLDPALAKRWEVPARVSGAYFRVEEFEPAQFEVEVKSSKEVLVMGDTASFDLEANWLFGAPMPNAELEWTARVEPFHYSSETFPGYSFGPSYSGDVDSDDGKTLKSAVGTTGESGRVRVDLELGGVPYRGDANLIFEGTVTSTNRRSITGYTSVPVARGAYRIGLKPASRFVPAEAPLTVGLVTLSPDGNPAGNKKLKVELVRREWSSVKKTDVDGRFRWVSEFEDKMVESREVTSGTDPASVSLTPSQAGFYIVRATGTDEKQNPILSETSFYAHGSGYVPWARGEGDSIELVPDKQRYEPGETAKILIKNPYEEATALITYERDLILHSYTTTVKGSAPVIEVPLTEEHLPNLYVSVMLFRGRTHSIAPGGTEDTGKPSFKMGLVDLAVSPQSRRLQVEITTDRERYGPNDEVVTRLKVTDSEGEPVVAELSLAAADVGVLNLIDFKTPDLFDTYYSSLPLAVRTAENRLDVIGQRSYGTKGENAGGGGGYGASFRKDFKSTAVWRPEVVTDEKGEAEVRFTLPENLTTFRVMATAISKDTRCGSAETEIVLTKPLILKPSAPAFARVGDTFQAGVLAVNGTDKGATVSVEMVADGIEADSDDVREVFLNAGEEREILFSFTPRQEGTATFQFAGKMGQETDGVEFQIPLQLSTQTVNLAHTGALDDGSVVQPIEVPRTAVAGTPQLEVKLSSSVLLGLENSVEELLDYPYGCLEQRLSRVTPLLLAAELVERLELEGWHEEKVRVQVQKTLELIPSYAAENGGLKIWPDSTLVHPFLTAQAVATADLAQREGYRVKGPWLGRARTYLKTYLDGKATTTYPFSEAEELVVQAAALDALTRSDFAGKAYLNRLMDKRRKMPVAGKALLLRSAHRLGEAGSVETLSTELTNSLKVENATAYFDVSGTELPWLYSSDARDTGLALEALLQSGDTFPLGDKVVTWLLEARNRSGTWGTTANNSAALAALVAYSRRFEESEPRFTVNISLDGQKLATEELSKTVKQHTTVEKLEPGAEPQVEVQKSGEGRLYYTLAVSYRDTEASPPVDEGFTVLRSITDLEGRPVQQFQGGELYKVKLTVLAPALRRYVMLRDPVPAGLSVVKTDFATESQQLAALLNRGEQPGWQTFHRFEDYADKILLFADALAPGEHTYEYLVRAQTPGTYLHPAAQVEEMYHPELFGRTAEKTVVVR